MSRGLGRLQRNLKAMIYEQHECWLKEFERRADADEMPEGQFWLTWPEIKYLIKLDMGLDPEAKLDPSFERSLKRALHLLLKRGEVRKIPGMPGVSCYITKECHEECFSLEADRKLLAALERLET